MWLHCCQRVKADDRKYYLSREDSHLFQVVSNSKFVSVGVQSPTEINAMGDEIKMNIHKNKMLWYNTKCCIRASYERS